MLEAGYIELQMTTHFSFLRGASSPDELSAAAAMLELPALDVVDRNSLAGLVRAWVAQKTTGVRSIAGSRLDLADGTAVLVYVPRLHYDKASGFILSFRAPMRRQFQSLSAILKPTNIPWAGIKPA